jgi:hypothetical protein
LKECAGKNWKAEFNVEDNEKNPDETLPDAHLHKLSGIRHNRRREQNWCGHLDDPFAEGHIFQNRLIGKASYLLKK